MDPLTVNTEVVIEKGCKTWGVTKGSRAVVTAVEPLGADYSHMVKVVLLVAGKKIWLYARHVNRLSDTLVGMNDGNPLHRIVVRRK